MVFITSKSFKKFMIKNMSSIIVFVMAVLGLSVLMSNFNSNKTKTSSGMTVQSDTETEVDVGPSASKPLGQNGDFETVSPTVDSEDSTTPGVSVPTCDPVDLLPADNNNEWAKLNPTGSGDLDSVNLLSAGHHSGIDTVGSSLRNANLQLRSEPANPRKDVGPWNITTIEPDLMRLPLEIGNKSM